jgi:argininosuccinate lyase
LTEDTNMPKNDAPFASSEKPPLKLWGGRFEGEIDKLSARLNNSYSFDCRLWREDIRGSIAHATMLGECGFLPEEDVRVIIDGLHQIEEGIVKGTLSFDPEAEDIHSAVESLLRTLVGATAGKLHTARSRNDQVATDTRLYLREKIEDIDGLLASFQSTLLDRAERALGSENESPVILSGYTHLQHAQPVLLSHHLLAYFWMFFRDRDRLRDVTRRMNLLPLGAGALAGVNYPVDRRRVAELLGFDGVIANSMDAVSDRDFILDFLSSASIIIMHCSRMAEELIIWNSPEFRYVELDDSVTTGSSIMPQKKNPDVAELARGKAGRIFGDLVGFLTVMKGLPLAYNKDMQEDKEPLFDAIDTLTILIPALNKTIQSAAFNSERMKEVLSRDFSTATDLADLLVRRGVPFREAHHIIGRMVRYCLDRQIGLEDLTVEERKSFSPLFQGGSEETASPVESVRLKVSEGGTSPEAVRKQLDLARDLFAGMLPLRISNT